jgi:peptidyl-prolyl cis-trans isomerase D
VTKSAMLDAAAADVAFSLEEGKVSAPFKGRFGFVLVRVVKVAPGSVRSFEDASGEIKRELAVERAKTEIANRHDKIEDARAGGQQLAEVADKLGMQARVIDAMDREGRDANGERVPDLPQAQGLIGGAFNSDIGIENDPLQLPGGGYVWFEVGGITPARDRTVDEVKDRVETRWRNDQIAERLKVKADALIEKAKSGTAFADIATTEEAVGGDLRAAA